MTVTVFNDSNHFLDEQEHQYAGQYPQAYCDLVIVVVGDFGRGRFDTTVLAVMVVAMMMVVVVVVVVFERGQRVRDQVQERVAQQSAGREAQEYLEERLVFVLVVDGYEEQYEKRQHADGHGGRQRSDPQHRVGDRGRRVPVPVVVVVTVVLVTVARAERRQRQEHEREQQHPANVHQETSDGRRHRIVSFRYAATVAKTSKKRKTFGRGTGRRRGKRTGVTRLRGLRRHFSRKTHACRLSGRSRQTRDKRLPA